jgi:hypothetical protein
MRDPVTRFLVLHTPNTPSIRGFLSWQVDIEDSDAVIYWYPSTLANQVTNYNYTPISIEVVWEVNSCIS